MMEVVKSLPVDLKASIFIVQHVAADTVSYLPQILSKAGPLRAVHPKDGEPIGQGIIYVAPPDHHMLIENGNILIKKGPKENNFRPSIDTLMRSAAYEYGPRVIGIVLTGYLNDGTSGLWSVKRLGGTTLVQNPEEAMYPDMPRNVLKYVVVDYILPLYEIGRKLGELVSQPVNTDHLPDTEAIKKRLKIETDIAAQQNAFEKGIMHMGEPSNLTCPECGGTLVSLQEGKLLRYRCHTGHGYSSGSLLSGITDSIETKLWQTLRSMEEGIMLLEQTATQYEKAGNEPDAKDFYHKAGLLRERSKVLLDFIYANGQINDITEDFQAKLSD